MRLTQHDERDLCAELVLALDGRVVRGAAERPAVVARPGHEVEGRAEFLSSVGGGGERGGIGLADEVAVLDPAEEDAGLGGVWNV